MRDMRTIVPRKKDRIIHVETALGIVNIWLGLMDSQGQRVERVEILPNAYAGGAEGHPERRLCYSNDRAGK